MTRKRFIKLLMARGVERNHAGTIAKIFKTNGVTFAQAVRMLEPQKEKPAGGASHE